MGKIKAFYSIITVLSPLPDVLLFFSIESPKEFSLYFHLVFIPDFREIPFFQIINLS